LEDNYISPDRLPALRASSSKMTQRHIKQA
jgi:hypothetical protein